MVASGNGSIVIDIVGLVLVIILQLIVFTLGSLSSGIQALRLHYVEFFMKFYKGGGTKFNPFRYERKYTIAE
jgi:V/A-type H+-transporting ATPase subunit I